MKPLYDLFSMGTFGFWSAFFAGGRTVMAGYAHTEIRYHLAELASNQLPNWQLLEDPCYMNGKVTDLCAKDREKYGLE